VKRSIGLISTLALAGVMSSAYAADLPSRVETITPIHQNKFGENAKKRRKQGGNPRIVNGLLILDGSMDGNRQVDPQIAIGGGFVLHATNGGLIIYDKKGHYIDGVRQRSFNGGIDPKLFFDPHNRVFLFDMWKYWDKAKKKPVNISVSETSDPRVGWNTYAISSPYERDGGGLGFSKKWIGYSFPGGKERTFVIRMADAKAGRPVKVYHFKGGLGQPVATEDDIDALYFFKMTKTDFIIRRVKGRGDGTPVWEEVARKPHHLKYVRHPPKSPQKGTKQLTASGDRNPKNPVLQGGCIWFSDTVNRDGRAAVQWAQVRLDGTIVQHGLLHDPHTSYIQTTIAVNKNLDVLVGFQETNEHMYISPRMAYRLASDPPGTLRPIIKLGEGKGATHGVTWGDYSGSTVDGDNFIDLWTIQSIADPEGKGDTVIVKLPLTDKRSR